MRKLVKDCILSKAIYIIDDERDARISLQVLLLSAGYEARSFICASDFLSSLYELDPGCLLLDVRMAGMDGIALLAELRKRRVRWPCILITGHANLSTAVAALKLGAVDLLEKPFSDQALMDALVVALGRLGELSVNEHLAVEQIAQLSPRELDAFKAVVAGESSKQLARRLGLSHRTVEMHRARMMQRLGIRVPVQAMALAVAAGFRSSLPDPESRSPAEAAGSARAVGWARS